MSNEENFKIEIRQQTNWKGTTYFYLYVNDVYVDLSPDLAEVEKMAQTALEVYRDGKHKMTVLKVIAGAPEVDETAV